jgi:NADPH:quinone reductase
MPARGPSCNLHPQGFDLLIDLINRGDDLLSAARILKPGGRLISTLDGPPQSKFPEIDITYTGLKAEPGDLSLLADRVVAGRQPVEIAQIYPLDDAPQAFIDLQSRPTRGKRAIAVEENRPQSQLRFPHGSDGRRPTSL